MSMGRIIRCQKVGTISNDEKSKLAKEYGCEYTINYKNEDVFEKVWILLMKI